VGTEIFLRKGLDTKIAEQPVGQISRPVAVAQTADGVTRFFIIDEWWVMNSQLSAPSQ
jgi:hypothetical protein